MNLMALLFQDGGGFGGLGFLLPFALIFAIFYFLVIRPQKRQQEDVKNMISGLKTGEEIVTNGGLIGKIIEVKETSFIIRSADKSILEIAKSAVVGKRAEEEKK